MTTLTGILYIIAGIFVVLAIGGLGDRERKQKKRRLTPADVHIDYSEDPDPITADVLSTYVGGARFYCDRADLRSFVGFVRLDPDNEAPAIYRNDLKMLGHIPRERLNEYRAWSRMQTLPCVGYVLPGANAETLASEVKVIKPHNREYVDSEISRYIGWVTLTHGNDTAPYPPSFEPLLDAETIARLEKERKKSKHANH